MLGVASLSLDKQAKLSKTDVFDDGTKKLVDPNMLKDKSFLHGKISIDSSSSSSIYGIKKIHQSYGFKGKNNKKVKKKSFLTI